MPKALFFTTDFSPSSGGGICTHSKFVADSLRLLGWDFIVLSEFYIPSSDEAIKIYSEKSGIPIYKLPQTPTLFSLVKKAFFCLQKCRKHKPDVLIGSGRHPVWFAALISYITRIPLVTIGHGTEFTQVTSIYDLSINKWAYSRSNLLITVSEYTKKVAIQQGICPNRIEVIHNPADESFFRVLEKDKIDEFKKAKDVEDRKIILTVGSLSERKGQRIVIESLPTIKKAIPNILYVAIGAPALKEKFIDLAEDLNVSENILFPGLVNEYEVLDWMNACDLFAMTSLNFNGDYEGFGIAVIEAALCGKTSIVSDNGGLKEAVINGETGLVVSEGDSVETSKQIISLLTDDKLRNRLAESARLRALQKNTYNVKGRELHYIMSDLLFKEPK